MLIDADTAYALATERLSTYAIGKLYDIGQAITKASEEGKFWVEIDGYVDEFIRKELESRGYIVVQYMNQRDGCYYVVKWKKG